MSNLAKLYDFIIRPVITEKSTIAGELNKYTFIVHNDANKPEIKKAVESIFSVGVTGVNIISVHGKNKRFRGRAVKKPDLKKAIVTLKAGDVIDFTTGV